jgi:hypothetical protein
MNTALLSGRLVSAPEQRLISQNPQQEALTIVEAMFEFIQNEQAHTIRILARNGMSELLMSQQVGTTLLLQGSLIVRAIEREDRSRETLMEMAISAIHPVTAYGADQHTMSDAEVTVGETSTGKRKKVVSKKAA